MASFASKLDTSNSTTVGGVARLQSATFKNSNFGEHSSTIVFDGVAKPSSDFQSWTI